MPVQHFGNIFEAARAAEAELQEAERQIQNASSVATIRAVFAGLFPDLQPDEKYDIDSLVVRNEASEMVDGYVESIVSNITTYGADSAETFINQQLPYMLRKIRASAPDRHAVADIDASALAEKLVTVVKSSKGMDSNELRERLAMEAYSLFEPVKLANPGRYYQSQKTLKVLYGGEGSIAETMNQPAEHARLSDVAYYAVKRRQMDAKVQEKVKQELIQRGNAILEKYAKQFESDKSMKEATRIYVEKANAYEANNVATYKAYKKNDYATLTRLSEECKNNIKPALDEATEKAKKVLAPIMDELRQRMIAESTVSDADARGWVGKQHISSGAKRLMKNAGVNIEETLFEYYKISNGKLDGVSVETTRSSRAFQNGGSIHLNERSNKRTVFHELSHALDRTNFASGMANRSFIVARSGGKAPVTLNAAMKRAGFDGTVYKRTEKALVDSFYDPYVGKDYVSEYGEHAFKSSEVLSMGVQALADLDSFAKIMLLDKEHLALALGVMTMKKAS